MSEHDIPVDQVSGVEERPQNRREWSGVLRSLVLAVPAAAPSLSPTPELPPTAAQGKCTDAGGPVTVSVVNVRSMPMVVPAPFEATTRKWYSVLAVKPVTFAPTGWNVFPVRFCGAVVSP